MSDFICKKCGSTEYEIKDKPNGTGIAHGLYCAKCGFWHKWLGKEELKQYATKESKDEIIAKLQSENAALRERIDKAVEVLEKLKEEIEPRVYPSFFGFVVQVRTLQEHKEIYGTEEAALARLAELKGGDHE